MIGSTYRKSVVVSAIVGAVALGACGSDAEETTAPAATEFPKSGGRTTEEIFASVAPGDEFVVSPTGEVFREGKNRFGFGVFDVGHEQLTQADVAIYAGRPGKPAMGPYPAQIESMATEPEFSAASTSADPDAALAVYVSELEFDELGEWRIVALIRDGETLRAVRTPSIVVDRWGQVPTAGEPAPEVHTPTSQDVSDLDEIDTREPHDTMHEVDFADALGRRPAVILFATPLLCQSRVCGPVVDVAEQVKAEYGEDVDFVHMEIFEDNEIDKGLREEVAAFGLRTEPWLFVVDSDGRITTAIEGAFGVDELESAVKKVAG